MPVASLKPGYAGPNRDAVDNYHGAQLVYVHWEGHLNFCAAITLPLPADTPFGALTGEVLPHIYGADPDWASVNLSTAHWTLDGKDWSPDPAKSIGEQGVGHKSLIRFWTDRAGSA
ncbi:phenol hydroxylase subunit P4 [Sphingobium sp. EM0848]|uniref:phenol hydroxylase subunit P4 n=1 Tax=Sphingobium sp. EM0848 TaxID=2743473 RepID=UPI00159C9148|nr:phenol hydroxylase subunit P4 [Sphingobium sp. EM0848]